MTITIYKDIVQGSPEWFQCRLGLLTASEMSLIITPTLKIASNEKERGHLFELMAQRITNYVEPRYMSDDMVRGHVDEIYAKEIYVEKYGPIEEVGFVTRDGLGVTIGASPDGLVGDDGLVECKSRRMKFQIQTILEDEVPSEYSIQLQTLLIVTGREWVDFLSFSAGLPLYKKRVFPDKVVQDAILSAAIAFEERLAEKMAAYTKEAVKYFPTERREDAGDEIVL